MSSKKINNFSDLKGKVALITGASGNLGREISNTLAEFGVDLLLVDHPNAELDNFKQKIDSVFNIKSHIYYCDLEKEKSRQEIITKILDEHELIDILINNAAFTGSSSLDGWLGNIEEQSTESWRRAIEVNLTAPFHLVQKLKPLLELSKSGSIINIGSIYANHAPDFSLYENTNMGNPAAYGVSKAGLNYLTKWLSTALAPVIRVNSINPGGILRNQPNEFIERYSKKTPLNRMAKESDIIGMILYLSSDLSSYMTGQIINVDGGWSVW